MSLIFGYSKHRISLFSRADFTIELAYTYFDLVVPILVPDLQYLPHSRLQIKYAKWSQIYHKENEIADHLLISPYSWTSLSRQTTTLNTKAKKNRLPSLVPPGCEDVS